MQKEGTRVMANQRVRIVIADDQRPARQGLNALLATCPEVEVVGEAVNGREAIRLVAECQPDVVLMDVRMPVMDGVTATVYIKNQWPQVKVIVLTLYGNHRMDALHARADAFLIKGCPTEDLVEAILNQQVPQEHEYI